MTSTIRSTSASEMICWPPPGRNTSMMSDRSRPLPPRHGRVPVVVPAVENYERENHNEQPTGTWGVPHRMKLGANAVERPPELNT